MSGTKDDWSIGNLSQSTFAKTLFRLYTKSPTEDENALIRGDKLAHYAGYPLRKYFINKEDNVILSIVWKSFYEIASMWPEQWSDENESSILKKTTGYISFIEVLRIWLNSNPKIIEEDQTIKDSFIRIKEKYESEEYIFTREHYPSGHQGVVILRDQLLLDLNIIS